jgi:hypothetical protein
MTSLPPDPRFFTDKLRHKGKWRLNKDHDLELVVTDTVGADKEVLTLKSEIVSVASNEIIFLITSMKQRGVEVTRLLKLSGKWQADGSNRLAFAVTKESGGEDVLVFDGAWEVGRENEIIYRYRKTRLKRKTKVEHGLIFKGHWHITSKDKLAYMLDTNGESGFVFKAEFEDAGICGRFGSLKYRVGVGVSRYKRPVEKVIKFLGAARWNITKKDALEFEFIGAEGRKSGMAVTLSRKLLGGEAFLRFKKMAKESKVEAGIAIPW